jgi:hypothetical protein
MGQGGEGFARRPSIEHVLTLARAESSPWFLLVVHPTTTACRQERASASNR